MPSSRMRLSTYGVDAEGNATTDVIVEPFKSLPVEPGPMVDCKIDIVAENLTSTSVKVVFNPSDPTVQYFYTMLDQAGYEDISKDWPGYIYEYMVSQLTDDGLPLSTIVMLSCSVGQQEVQSKTLQPETTYYACAVGVNSNATINTEVAVQKIVTPPDSPIDYGFDFDFGEVTATGARVTVSPRDVRAFYYWNVMTEEEYGEMKGDESKIAAYFEQKMIEQRKAQMGDYADWYPLPEFIASQCSSGFDGPATNSTLPSE